MSGKKGRGAITFRPPGIKFNRPHRKNRFPPPLRQLPTTHPACTLKRLKQWLRVAAADDTFTRFDAIKRGPSSACSARFTPHFTPSDFSLFLAFAAVFPFPPFATSFSTLTPNSRSWPVCSAKWKPR